MLRWLNPLVAGSRAARSAWHATGSGGNLLRNPQEPGTALGWTHRCLCQGACAMGMATCPVFPCHPALTGPACRPGCIWGWDNCWGLDGDRAGVQGPCGLRFRRRFAPRVLAPSLSGCQPPPKLQRELNWKERKAAPLIRFSLTDTA